MTPRASQEGTPRTDALRATFKKDNNPAFLLTLALDYAEDLELENLSLQRRLGEARESGAKALQSARQKYQDGFETVPFCELAAAMERLLSDLTPASLVSAKEADLERQEQLISALWCFSHDLQKSPHNARRSDGTTVNLDAVKRAEETILGLFGQEPIEIQ